MSKELIALEATKVAVVAEITSLDTKEGMASFIASEIAKLDSTLDVLPRHAEASESKQISMRDFLIAVKMHVTTKPELLITVKKVVLSKQLIDLDADIATAKELALEPPLREEEEKL